ncbi:golgin subfamily B member 1 [Ixodes scapularis]
MEVSKLRIPELVAVCEELGISVGQAKRRKPIMELLREKEVSDVELQEAWELIRERSERAKAERERDEKREREREKRARELAEKRLEIETLMQEVRSQRGTVVVEVTDSKYLAATFPHWFTYEGDPKPREKDLVSRRERAVALSGARTRQVAAETVDQKEKVEEEEFNSTDGDQGLCADGTTDAVPHNADSRPEALEVGGDPAKRREEASQASDVCFLGDEDKASMVMPPRKSIQLEESNVEKSADGEAEQEVGRPGRPPWNSETKPGLDERDQSKGCSEKASCSSRPSGKKEQKSKQRREDREKLYAQMVYKDSRILELSREAEALEARILDLQESLREKDQVLQARTRAVQLVTEDLSLRSKTAVDDLDDTRAEMQRLQRDFLEREAAWREREASLAADLAAGQARVKECEEAVRRVESTRFELATRNAELQERLVKVQEAAARGKAEHDRVVQEKLDSLNKELEAKSAALEEAQGTLRETDARILKARALERRRAKVLERELAELKKDLPDGEAMTVLQQRIAELEEEKGALQLRALETEDTLSAQASKLEEMAQKEAAIAELERQLKEAQEEKISLEMRAAELEEQKETEERKMQSLQQELEVLKTGSAPLLEQELKIALEEEVRRLVSQHEEDVGHAARLGEALTQAEAEAKSATARADELAETLQRTLGELEVERTEATKLKGMHAAEVRTKLEEVERLNAALHDMSESFNESLRAADEHSREAHDQIEANMAKIEELDTTHRDSLNELKRKSEQLEELKLALDDAQQAMESKTRDADMFSDALTGLKASLAEAENKHATLEATLSAKEREIQSTLESLGVSTLGEVNAAWEELRRASSLEIEKYHDRMAELDSRNKELTGKVESLDNALKEAETVKSRLAKVDACLESLAVSSLEELTHKWNTLNEDLATVTRTQKLNDEDIASQIKLLTDERSGLRMEIAAKDSKIADLASENEDWKQKEELVLGQLEELQKQYDNSSAESKRQLEEMVETCRSVTEEHISCKALLDKTTEELKETRIILAENQKESEATAQACASFKELSDQLAKEVSSLHLDQTKKQEELKRANAEKDSISEAVVNLKELVATKASQLDSLQVVLGSKDAELQSLRDSAELQQSDIAIKLSEMSKELELRTGELSLMKAALEERDALVVSLKEDAAAWSTKLQESEEINRNLNAQVESLAERFTEASKAIKAKEANLQKATEDLKTLMDSNEKLSRDLQVLQESCKELNDVKQDLELKVNVANSKVANWETTLTEQDHMVDKLRSELEATKAELVATSSKLKDTAGKAEEHEQKLKAAIESGSALVEEATRLRQEKESMASTLEKLRSQSGTAQDESDRLAEVIGLLRAELEDMKSRYQDLRVKNDIEAANHAEEISEKNSHLLALEDEVKKLRHENVKTKEHLGLVSAEIESLVGTHDQQLKELLDVEASLRAEVASFATELGEKKALVKDLQEQLEAAYQENVRVKEQLAMFSTESENMVGTRDQQLKELLDVEASLKAEVASFSTQLSEKQTLIRDLQGQLEASHQENVKVKEQLAMFSAEIENMVQNHDQQLREFSDANMKLESEVANYMTKMADNERSIQDLETKLDCLHQENASFRNQLALASADAEESAQGHDKQVKELKEQLQKLNAEVDRLQRFEDLYREAEVQLAEARGYHEAAEARLDALKHAADNEKRHETAAVMEEVLVQSAAKLQGASKGSQKKGEGDVQMSQSEELSKELESKQAEVEKLKSVLSSQEEDAKKLLEELETVKRSLETAEMQLKSSPQETQKFQGSTKSPQSEGTHETDELKKLKVAFKKSRGELRLKLRILEDKTKELDAVKAHNNSLQTDLQQMVEALSSEKLAAKELLHKMQDRDDQLALASEEVAKLREECAAAKTDLAVSLERISEEKALQEGLLERLKSAEIALSFSQTQEAAETLSAELQVLKTKHEEALEAKLELRGQLEQMTKDNRALSQQVQNWRSYIKGFEENKEGGKGLEASEVDRLRLELDQTMRNLHQLGLRNEEMSVDLSKVLEERNGLRHQLSHAQEALRQREDQLVRLQSRLPVSRDSHFVVVEDDSQQTDLHQRLAESERLRVELQETVEELRSSLRRERQRRTLIEDEWDLLEEGRRIEALPSDTRTLLLHEDIIKIPPTEYSIMLAGKVPCRKRGGRVFEPEATELPACAGGGCMKG